MNSKLKIQLDKIVNDLSKTDGVDGSLIVDGNGEILSHHLLQDVDIDLFGPMANVITGSSKRLINSANHGTIERVLVESKRGKALFLHLGNVHFIVLMKNNANVGMIMISSKRASQKIIDTTKDLTPIQLEEQISEPTEEEKIKLTEKPIPETVTTEDITVEDTKTPETTTSSEENIEDTIATVEYTREIIEETLSPPAEETIPETMPEEKMTATVQEETITEPLTEKPKVVTQEKTVEETQTPFTKEKISVESRESLHEESIEKPETGEKTPKTSIPVIKPPIAFPKLKKITEIPEDEAERADIILKIYESIFLAMSIGASKIMGVAPARGLTRKFLPVEECKTLLDGVDVKNNSTIDFIKIKENAEKIPLPEREQSFIENFGKILTIITENYGKVMGYSAFRAMIRPQFRIINESYGHVLNELGIKEQLHPEIRDFFN